MTINSNLTNYLNEYVKYRRYTATTNSNGAINLSSLNIPLIEMQISTLGASVNIPNDGLTAPSDGYFKLEITGAANTYAIGAVNGVTVMELAAPTSSNAVGHIIQSVFVRKGAVLTFTGSPYSKVFIPFQ